MENDMRAQGNPAHQAAQPHSGFLGQETRPEYVTQDHQIPAHGTPDPALSYNPYSPQPQQSFAQAPQPVYTPPAMHVQRTLEVSNINEEKPVPVVKVLSVRGVEYAMMSIMLWVGAASLIILLSSLIVGGGGFDVLSFPLTTLLVSLPIFAFFFLRLRKAELADPNLRLEPSKRRFSQITQFVTFITCFSNLVALVYAIVSAIGGKGGSLGKTFGVTAVIFLIAGGIFFYYWRDEHKLVRR